MSVAQQLYEGVELGSAGPVGLITYMRTDSTRISDVAKAQAADHIVKEFGKQYVRSGAARQRAVAANVQDAHEAIRPTDVTRTPESLRDQLDPAQHRLYDLIWRRFVASQMAAARFLNTRASLAAGEYLLPRQRLGAAVRRLPEGVEARGGSGQGARRARAARAGEGRAAALRGVRAASSTSPSRRRATPRPP